MGFPAKTLRNSEIYYRILAGERLCDVAESYGISSQRVIQIVDRISGTSAKDRARRRHDREERMFSMYQTVGSYTEVAREFGTSPQTARNTIMRVEKRLWSKPREDT